MHDAIPFIHRGGTLMTNLSRCDVIRLLTFSMLLLILPPTSWAQQRPPIAEQMAKQQGQNDGHRYLVCSRGWGRKIGCDRLNRGMARRFRRRPISGSVAACRRLPILMVCPLPR